MAFISSDISVALGTGKRVRSSNLRGAVSQITVELDGSMFAAPRAGVGDVILLCPISYGACIKDIRMISHAAIGGTAQVAFSIGVFGINPGHFNPTNNVYDNASFSPIVPDLLRANAEGAGQIDTWAHVMNPFKDINSTLYSMHTKTLYQLLTIWNDSKVGNDKLFNDYKTKKECELGITIGTLATGTGITNSNKIQIIIEYVDMTVSGNETLMDIGR